MHRSFLAGALALVASTSLPAADTTIDAESLAAAARLRDATVGTSEAYEIVESLTTEVGARLAGSPNDARAVEWAERKFRQYGFDRVWREEVTFPRWERRRESAEIVSPFPHKLVLTALGATVSTNGPLSAEVVEFATLDALKQADRAQVEGRIVFIGNRMERAKNGAGYGPAVAARSQGAFVAASLGAKALLIRSIGTDSHRFPHTGSGVSRDYVLSTGRSLADFPKTDEGEPIVATPIPAAALSNPDADLLMHVLERGKPVTLKLDLDVGFNGSYRSANVIGEITGTEKPDEFVVIGGHLDSWDLGTGAIDDAAGIGITMAAAHRIRQLGLKPKRSIRVVAFSNEEQGLYGGAAFAKVHGGANVANAIIGSESDFGAGRIYEVSFGVADHPKAAAAAIAEVMKPLGIALVEPAEGSGPGPDLGAMKTAGMAWAKLQQDGTDYFDYHHTPDDTLDKVDSASLDQNAAAYAVLAYLAAQAEGGFGSAPTATDSATPPTRRP